MADFFDRTTLVILIFLLFLGALFFLTSGVMTTGASEDYMNAGLKMYLGQPYTFFKRGPLFPVLVALFYAAFGVSVKGAFLVIRLFYVLNIFITFFLGRMLYNHWVGLAASLLVLSSYGINYASSFLLVDNIMSFFILLYLTVCYLAVYHHNRTFYVCAGVCLALTFYVKPFFTVFLFFLPFFMRFVLPGDEKKNRVGNLMYFTLSFAIVMGLWLYYGFVHGVGVYELFGFKPIGAIFDSDKAYQTSIFGSIFSVVLKMIEIFSFSTLKKFYVFHMKKFFPLAPIMVISICFVIGRFWKIRQSSDGFILLAFFCLSPVVLPAVYRGNRMAVLLVVYFLFYIMIASALYDILKFVYVKVSTVGTNRFGIHYFYLADAFFLFTFLAYQWFHPGISTKKLLLDGISRNAKWSTLYWTTGRFWVEGRYNNYVEKTSKWLLENVSSGTKIIAAFGRDPINFFTQYSYKILVLEPDSMRNSAIQIRKKALSKDKRRVIVLYPRLNFSPDVEVQRHMFILFEEDLLAKLIEYDAEYLVIGERYLYLSFYFESVTWAELKYRNNKMSVFKIDRKNIAENPNCEMIVSDNYQRVVNWWREKYPEEYAKHEELLGDFGLSNEYLFEHSYTAYQRKWVEENIPENSRIGFFWHTSKFLIEGDPRAEFIGYKNHKLEKLSKKYDFLFIHNDQRFYNTFPDLFKQLDQLSPFKIFPTIHTLGDNGWEIYDLREVRERLGISGKYVES